MKTYVIYLGKSKVPRQITENEMVRFEPGFFRIAEMDSQKALMDVKNKKGNIIEMALVPLMDNCTKELIKELVDEEAVMDVERNLKDDILTSTLVMTRTVYDEEFVNSLKVRLIKMFDVGIFEKERKEAIEQGLQQGLKQGELEKLREVVSRQLFVKFKERYTSDLKVKVT